MAAPDIDRLVDFTDMLADAARAAIMPFFRMPLDVDNKGGAAFDPVTQADRNAEQAIRALIEREYPEHGILGEEFGETPSQSGFTWIIDPIDGTRAFIAGLPLWGVLIGLAFEGKPIVGVMDQPFLDERYRGFPGGANFTTRDVTLPLKRRACVNLSDAMISTTDPTLFRGRESEAFGQVRARAKLTRYGYDCYAYSMVAAGHLDCVVESGLKTYDIAALIPIITGAGGGVCSWAGDDASGGGQVLAYGDSRVRDEALHLLRDATI